MIADNIKTRIAQYYKKKKRVIFPELGLLRRGRLRADLLVLAMTGHIVIVEVKSSVSDYKADARKKGSYLEYCNQFYYAMPEPVYLKVVETITEGIGVFIMSEDGTKLRKVTPAKNRELKNEVKLSLAIRAAFRNAPDTTRKNKRI